MALPAYCPHCQATKLHNSRGKCLDCVQKEQKQEFEEWKSDKSLEEQIENLYLMIKNLKTEIITYL